LCFKLALTFYPLPQERKWLLADSGFADDCPANSVARIFKQTENDSPSPWGEGRDVGERYTKETRNAGEKPVHGFMDSLLNPKTAVLVLVY
jgi:hypothetical protein